MNENPEYLVYTDMSEGYKTKLYICETNNVQYNLCWLSSASTFLNRFWTSPNTKLEE